MEFDINFGTYASQAVRFFDETEKTAFIKSVKTYRRFYDKCKVEEMPGENFNIFSALTRHHLEELHSRQLYYLLNPNSSHGLKGTFLKIFFETLAVNSDLSFLTSLHDEQDLLKAVVRREHIIGWAFETKDYGRIDLLIETPKCIIAIENKVNAQEQSKQLQRYYNYCDGIAACSRKKVVILYLTLQGTESSEDFKEYVSISYITHVLHWLEKSIESTKKLLNVSAGLYFYADLIRTHLLGIKSSKQIEQMKNALLLKENISLLKELDASKLKSLIGVVEEARNKLRRDFFAEFDRQFRLKTHFPSLIPIEFGKGERIHVNEVWNHKGRGFRLNEWRFITASGKVALFAIEHNWDGIWYGLRHFDTATNPVSPARTEIDNSEIESLTDEIGKALGISLESPEEGWFAWRYFELKEEGNIGSDTLNYVLATEMGSCAEDFIKEICLYLDAYQSVAGEKT